MIKDIKLSAIDENRYAMLSYLAIRGQLLNQIEVFDSLWDELLEQPMQQSWLRLLRINLRKLRSAIKLLEPLLPLEGQQWLAFLKNTADILGSVREYDVALKECDKYVIDQLAKETSDVERCQELNGLKALLSAKRKEQTEVLLATSQPGCIASAMQDLLKLIDSSNELTVEEEALANAFLQARLQSWGMKLCNRLQNEAEVDNIEKLHSLRIKVKRFRYAYSVYMNRDVDSELLECLKNAQDLLGSVHDGDCDISIMESLINGSSDEQLVKELACFKEWRLEKTRQRLENLPRIRSELIYALKANVAGASLL